MKLLHSINDETEQEYVIFTEEDLLTDAEFQADYARLGFNLRGSYEIEFVGKEPSLAVEDCCNLSR